VSNPRKLGWQCVALRGLPGMLWVIGSLLVFVPPANAAFGIASVDVEANNAGGIPAFRASSHPAEFSFSMELNGSGSGDLEEPLRAVRVDLPAGFVGNPLAIPRCARADFEGTVPRCSGDSQIGLVRVVLPGISGTENPLYNLIPAPGFAASFGFSAVEFTGFEQASLRTGRDYGLSETVAPVPNGALQSISEAIWGVPADPSHDAERFCYQSDGTRVEGCASNVKPAPFLTLPATCDSPVEIRVAAESVRGVVATKTASLLGSDGNPSLLTGCDEVPFKPQFTLGFTSSAADSPTGTAIQIHLPQPNGASTLAESPLRNATIRFPEGLAINPSAAAGLAACTAAQIGLESPPGQIPGEFTPAPASCPDAAKIGTVGIDTPILDHPLTGAVYLAESDRNPFGSLFAAYLAVDDEASGVVLKLPAVLEADPVTGRLTLRLQDSPQLPVEDLRISLNAGPRALLRTPLTCGDAPIQGSFASWSVPQEDVSLGAQLQVNGPAAGASACPVRETDAPVVASLTAGTLVPAAGRPSPFLLRVGRPGGSRRLSRIEATLPLGLTAKLAGVSVCTEAEVALAGCPAASLVGSADVAAGAGSLPLRLPGRIFLAGPYRGAPFSLLISTPAVAGPFDLGTLSVRVAMHVDPWTARIRAVSDQLPTILGGVPLNLRSVALDLDRPGFIRNPTSCEPMTIAGSVSGLDREVPVSDRFQVGDCAALPFQPRLSVRLLGSAARGAHPRVRATLRAGQSGANLKRIVVDLPRSELLDQKRIGSICALPAADVERCPSSSAVAYIEVQTPLLSDPLAGPVFLRPSKQRLPGLVAVLDGEVQLRLSGHLGSAKGSLRIGFTGLPDVPLDALTLRVVGGKKGILVNSGGVCTGARRLTATLGSHSGRTLVVRPRLQARCPAG
jgi:hypothetical protein